METEHQPLISIIIPVYQVKKYLKRCLKSVVSQTYKNYEIILVDDGSTDGSGQICDEFLEKFGEKKTIQVFHTQNKGLAAARNFGLSHAQGKYITFIDSDDAYMPEFLEMMQQVMRETSVKLVEAASTSKEEEFAGHAPVSEPEFELYTNEEAFEKYVSDAGVTGYAWGKLYDASLFDGIRYPENISHGQDSFTTFKFLLRAKKMAYVKNPLYFYYRHSDTLTGSFSPNRIKLRAVAGEMREFVKNENFQNIRDIFQMIDSYEVRIDFMMLNYYIGHGQQKKYEKDMEDVRKSISRADFSNPYIRSKYRMMRTLLKAGYGGYCLFSYVSQKMLGRSYW